MSEDKEHSVASHINPEQRKKIIRTYDDANRAVFKDPKDIPRGSNHNLEG